MNRVRMEIKKKKRKKEKQVKRDEAEVYRSIYSFACLSSRLSISAFKFFKSIDSASLTFL